MKLVKNFLSLAGAEAFSKLATFAAVAYLARVLGPDYFGFVEFAVAVLMCASLIVDQGFSPFGAREIARAPEQSGRLMVAVVTARMVLAAGCYLAIVLVAFWVERGAVMIWLLLVYGLSLWAMPLMLQWVFQGHDRMTLVAVAQVIRQVVFAGTVFAFVRGPEQIVTVAWAEVAGVTSAAAFCVWIYWRHFRTSTEASPSPSPVKRLIREGVPIGLSQIFWVVKMFGGTLILGIIASTETVAYFAGAQRIMISVHTFIWLYFFNLLPSMSRSWQQDDGSFSRLIGRSLHGVAWASVAGGLVWMLLANDAMRIVYGPEYLPGGTALALMSGVCVMAFVSGHYRFGLIAGGHQSAEMLISALGAAIALVLIPVGYFRWGINGAASGLVVAEGVIWLSSWLWSRHLLSLTGHAKLLLRPLIALALASGAWLLPLASTKARAALAIILFTVLAWTLDSTVRKRLRETLALRRSWSGRRLARGLAKAHDGIKA